MAASVWDLPDGSTFVATERHIPEITPFGNFTDQGEDSLIAWAIAKWNTLWRLKQAENERLKLMESFYQGDHYEDPFDNRNEPITNYCFSVVEAIWPILTQARPRPEPVPRRSMDADRIKRIAMYAQYKMDTCGFDRVFRVCVRDLLKFGWCCPMIGWNDKGTAVSRYLSPFDYYPDTADDESDIECFAIAFPVQTRRLQMLYPEVADRIVSDQVASPRYEVTELAKQQRYAINSRFAIPNFAGPIDSAIMEGSPAATTTGNWAVDTGNFRNLAETTFFIQLFVRDYTTMPVMYRGTRYTVRNGFEVSVPHSESRREPCCPSGWRHLAFTIGGVLVCKPKPVDECLNGTAVTIGRNYEEGGSFYSKGELDDAIPLQRDINYSDAMLRRALQLQADPPVLVSNDSRIDTDKSSVEGGEIIRHTRGATISYLQPNAVAESHFEARAVKRQDMQIVTGTPDALAGQRPVGIEAGVAIKQLQESATSRARAKGPAMLEWAAIHLKKMMDSDAIKSNETIYFRGPDGREMWLDPSDMAPEDYDIRWASQSGTAQGEQDRQDLDLQLLQLGVVDAEFVRADLDLPGREQISQREAMRAQATMQAQQAAAAPSPTPPPAEKPKEQPAPKVELHLNIDNKGKVTKRTVTFDRDSQGELKGAHVSEGAD